MNLWKFELQNSLLDPINLNIEIHNTESPQPGFHAKFWDGMLKRSVTTHYRKEENNLNMWASIEPQLKFDNLFFFMVIQYNETK